MLSCRDLANKVASDYVDGHLGLRARLGVRLHLALCENCRRFIKQLQQVRAVIRQRNDVAVDNESDAQLRNLATQLHALAQHTTEQQKKNSS